MSRQPIDNLPVACPVSCGLATKLTASSFEAACYKYLNSDSHFAGKRACLECGGRYRPSEIEIITLDGSTPGLEDTMAKSTRGACDNCGRNLILTRQHGQDLCSTCAVITRAARNTPDHVTKALVGAGRGEAIGDTSAAAAAHEDELAALRRDLQARANEVNRLTVALDEMKKLYIAARDKASVAEAGGLASSGQQLASQGVNLAALRELYWKMVSSAFDGSDMRINAEDIRPLHDVVVSSAVVVAGGPPAALQKISDAEA